MPDAVLKDILSLQVPYDQSARSVIACTSLSSCDEDIGLCLVEEKPTRAGTARLGLFLFPTERVSAEQAVAAMRAQAARPATLIELLALARHRPHFRCPSPVICLGTTWPATHGECRVAAFFSY